MQLFVIAKKSLVPHIYLVEKNAENTGFMHVFPNKVILGVYNTMTWQLLSMITDSNNNSSPLLLLIDVDRVA